MITVKLSERQWMVVHAVATVLILSSTAYAQEPGSGGALIFLDKIADFFLGIVNHRVWAIMLGTFFVGFAGLYAKTRNPAALFGALGCAAAGGIWVARSTVWSEITGVGL